MNLNKLTAAELAAFQLDQENTLLHEVIHALGLASDSDFFSNAVFQQNGLTDTNGDYRNYGNTGAITKWLQNDCKK